MIVVDVDKPKYCANCLMSCKCFDKILCRNDMKEHTPMDDGCLIKSEITEETYKLMCCCCASIKEREKE